MSDRRRSTPPPPKFRRHFHPRPRSRRRGSPQPHQHHAHSSDGPEFSVHLDSPHGSNELYIVDVFDGASGKEGHTSVAIYATNPPGPLTLPPPEKKIDVIAPPRKPRQKLRPESDRISQTGSPFDLDELEDHPKLVTLKNRKGNKYIWGSDDVDTQDVASDTLDLGQIMHSAPFLLNFSHYVGQEFSVNVCLRKKYNLPFVNASTFIPPSTDDYNREFFRYLKTQQQLKTLKLILEVHADDDVLIYKTFDENGLGGSDVAVGVQNNFPVIQSNPGTFWTCKTIPIELTSIHVELPGISTFYLNDWKRFLEMQTRLASMICNFGALLWTFYVNVVANNEKTLEKVVLRRIISYDVRNQKQQPFDFGTFQNCSQLNYLKITGGGYKDRWGELTYMGQEQAQIEVLLHVNFDLLPLENLVEFHFSKMNINKKRLQELAASCQDKKLQLICADCPDREYTDGDWQIVPQKLGPEKVSEADDESSTDVELAVMFGGNPVSQRHAEYYKNQQQQKTYMIVLLLVLCTIAFVGMTVAIAVAIAYSNEGRHDRT